jgi:hypothetical protein
MTAYRQLPVSAQREVDKTVLSIAAATDIEDAILDAWTTAADAAGDVAAEVFVTVLRERLAMLTGAGSA